MRLIDADKLFRDIPLKVCCPCPFGEEKECEGCVIDKLMKIIEDAPTIDAVPVVHGEWLEAGYDDEIDFGRHLYFCSVCNKHADSFVGGSEDWWCSRKPNFCPNCGAKMDGKEQSDG